MDAKVQEETRALRASRSLGLASGIVSRPKRASISASSFPLAYDSCTVSCTYRLRMDSDSVLLEYCRMFRLLTCILYKD